MPGTNLGAGSVPRVPRPGALPAVPRHPVRAQARLRAVPRAGATGGAVAAALEVLCIARRHCFQPGGRHAARAAAPPAEHCERLRAVVAVVIVKARDVERGGARADPVDSLGGRLGAICASLE